MNRACIVGVHYRKSLFYPRRSEVVEKKNADEKQQNAERAAVEEAKDAPDVAQGNQEGADADFQNRTSGHVFGDTTSSNGQQNMPGQHGRDGGVVDGRDANPAPSDAAIENADENRDGGDTNMAEEVKREESEGEDKPKTL
jgi:hypothetical protein